MNLSGVVFEQFYIYALRIASNPKTRLLGSLHDGLLNLYAKHHGRTFLDSYCQNNITTHLYDPEAVKLCHHGYPYFSDYFSWPEMFNDAKLELVRERLIIDRTTDLLGGMMVYISRQPDFFSYINPNYPITPRNRMIEDMPAAILWGKSLLAPTQLDKVRRWR